jgi:hypothetical protein
MAISFWTLLNFGNAQNYSFSSCESLAKQLDDLIRGQVPTYNHLLMLTPHFFNMMTSIRAAELDKVLPNFNCASCGGITTLHISADGNFKLSRVKRNELLNQSAKIRNFILSEEDIHDFATQKDVKMACSSTFKAINERGTGRNGPAVDETGLVGIFCARHGTPLLFVNSKAGEKACYVDSLLIKFLNRSENTKVKKIFLYYDINCNYEQHYTKYKAMIGKLYSLIKDKKINHVVPVEVSFLIPLMHVKVHKQPCPWLRNPKYFTGCGLTDGETCERAWSKIGRCAMITKNMTSGHRMDMLERYLFHFYVETTKNHGKNMQNKLKNIKLEIQELMHNGFTQMVTKEHLEISNIIAHFAQKKRGDTEIERLDLRIKSIYQQLIQYNISYNKLGYNHNQVTTTRTNIYQLAATLPELMASRNRLSGPNRQQLTKQILKDESSWFWKVGLEVEEEKLERWKKQERFFRLVEEKEMLINELHEYSKIKDGFVTFLNEGPSLPVKKPNAETHEAEGDREEREASTQEQDEASLQASTQDEASLLSLLFLEDSDSDFEEGLDLTLDSNPDNNKENQNKCFKSDGLSVTILDEIRSETFPKNQSFRDFVEIEIDNIPVTCSLLQTLVQSDSWLNDEMINAFFRLLGAAYPGSLFLSITSVAT